MNEPRTYGVKICGFGHSKVYVVEAYSQYEAEKEVLHMYRSQFPMNSFYAKIDRI